LDAEITPYALNGTLVNFTFSSLWWVVQPVRNNPHILSGHVWSTASTPLQTGDPG